MSEIKLYEDYYLLVLDANILIKDFWLKGQSFNYLKDRDFLLHKLTIPQISLDEAMGAIIRRATDLLLRLEEQPKSFRLLEQYQKLFNKSKIDNETAEELGERYQAFIKKFVEEYKGFIIQNVDVDMQTIIQRSINRVKPFNQGDKGFRDTVLWLNILELVKKYPKVSFVSENINDFAEKENLTLHPDLKIELYKYLNEDYNFLFFRNLDAFIAVMDKDKKIGAEAFLKALITKGYKNFILHEWLKDNLIQAFEDSIHENFDGVAWAGLPYWAEAPNLIKITKIVGIEPYRAKFIEENLVEFFIDVALVGDFIASVLFADPEEIIYYKQVKKVKSDKHDSFWSSVVFESIATFIIKLTFDIKSQEVKKFYGTPLLHNFKEAIESIENIIELEKLDTDEDF